MDIGAGVGHLASDLASEGYTVLAIEGNEVKSRNYAVKVAGNPEIQCIAANIQNEFDLNVTQEPCISLSLRMSYLFNNC